MSEFQPTNGARCTRCERFVPYGRDGWHRLAHTFLDWPRGVDGWLRQVAITLLIVLGWRLFGADWETALVSPAVGFAMVVLVPPAVASGVRGVARGVRWLRRRYRRVAS